MCVLGLLVPLSIGFMSMSQRQQKLNLQLVPISHVRMYPYGRSRPSFRHIDLHLMMLHPDSLNIETLHSGHDFASLPNVV